MNSNITMTIGQQSPERNRGRHGSETLEAAMRHEDPVRRSATLTHALLMRAAADMQLSLESRPTVTFPPSAEMTGKLGEQAVVAEEAASSQEENGLEAARRRVSEALSNA